MVKEALLNLNISGINMVPVEIINQKDNKLSLWEIEVIGEIWNQGVNKENITDCKICNRKIFPYEEKWNIDYSRWDGSEFFHS